MIMVYQEYLKKLNSYNRSLKSIAKKAGLTEAFRVSNLYQTSLFGIKL